MGKELWTVIRACRDWSNVGLANTSKILKWEDLGRVLVSRPDRSRIKGKPEGLNIGPNLEHRKRGERALVFLRTQGWEKQRFIRYGGAKENLTRISPQKKSRWGLKTLWPRITREKIERKKTKEEETKKGGEDVKKEYRI